MQIVLACGLLSVASAGLLAGPHGALSSQNLILGAPGLAPGYGHGFAGPAIAGPAFGAPALGYGLGIFCFPLYKN